MTDLYRFHELVCSTFSIPHPLHAHMTKRLQTEPVIQRPVLMIPPDTTKVLDEGTVNGW